MESSDQYHTSSSAPDRITELYKALANRQESANGARVQTVKPVQHLDLAHCQNTNNHCEQNRMQTQESKVDSYRGNACAKSTLKIGDRYGQSRQINNQLNSLYYQHGATALSGRQYPYQINNKSQAHAPRDKSVDGHYGAMRRPTIIQIESSTNRPSPSKAKVRISQYTSINQNRSSSQASYNLQSRARAPVNRSTNGPPRSKVSQLAAYVNNQKPKTSKVWEYGQPDQLNTQATKEFADWKKTLPQTPELLDTMPHKDTWNDVRIISRAIKSLRRKASHIVQDEIDKLKNEEMKTEESTTISQDTDAVDKVKKENDVYVNVNVNVSLSKTSLRKLLEKDQEPMQENFESTIDEDLPESPPHTKNINAFARFGTSGQYHKNKQLINHQVQTPLSHLLQFKSTGFQRQFSANHISLKSNTCQWDRAIETHDIDETTILTSQAVPLPSSNKMRSRHLAHGAGAPQAGNDNPQPSKLTYLLQYQQQLRSLFEQKTRFDGFVEIFNGTSRELFQCHIENQRIVFYGKEQRAMHQKITQKLDQEFAKDMPDLNAVKMLSKKVQNMQHAYDGIIKFDSEYTFECYVKWVFHQDQTSQLNSQTLKLQVLLQVQGVEMQLKMQAKESLTHPDSLALVMALSSNLSQGQNVQRNDFAAPLVLDPSAKGQKPALDVPQARDSFQCLFRLDPSRKMWNQRLKISLAQFRAQVQTGDILLFQHKDLAPRMQRMVTGSQYDHVGMMIKYPKSGHIQIFESLRAPGVQKWNWDTFIAKKWNSCYSRIVYRKLNMYGPTSTLASREQLDRIVFGFLVQTVGNPFRLTYDKLVQKTNESEADTNQSIPRDRGFFCSELIALVYKYLGLLPKEKAASQYWPGSFSAERVPDPDNDDQMVLLGEGNELSEEYEIEIPSDGEE